MVEWKFGSFGYWGSTPVHIRSDANHDSGDIVNFPLHYEQTGDMMACIIFINLAVNTKQNFLLHIELRIKSWEIRVRS